MSRPFSQWLFYSVGAPIYEQVLGAWTLGRWWRWQRAALEGLPKDEPILEIGCGTGRLLQQRLAVGPAVGMDLSVPMLRRARLRLASHPGGPPVLMADASRLPFPEASFGAAVSTGVLSTIPQLRPVLGELCRVVRPGGRLAFVEMMPPGRPTVRGQLMVAALRAARDRFHDLPALLAEFGVETEDRELGRAGTVHLITGTVGGRPG